MHGLAFLLSVLGLSWGHGRWEMQEKSNGGKFLQIVLHNMKWHLVTKGAFIAFRNVEAWGLFGQAVCAVSFL